MIGVPYVAFIRMRAAELIAYARTATLFVVPVNVSRTGASPRRTRFNDMWKFIYFSLNGLVRLTNRSLFLERGTINGFLVNCDLNLFLLQLTHARLHHEIEVAIRAW